MLIAKLFSAVRKILQLQKWPYLNLQQRLLVFFVFFIFIPIIIIFLTIYNLYFQFMNEKIQLYTYQMVKEINNNIDSNLTIYNRLTMQIYANREIIENMKKSHRDFNEQFEIENSIRATLRSLINTDRYITSAYLVTTDGVKYVDGIEFPGLEEKFPEYQRLAREADGRVVWVPSDKLKNYYGKDVYIFGALREIKSSDGTRVGMLILLIREEFFEDIYRDIYFAENARRLIITKDCIVASSINKQEIGGKIRDRFFKKLALTADGALIERIKREKYLAISATSMISGWKFVSIIPLRDLLKEVQKVRNIMLLVIALSIFFLICLFYYFSNRVTLPIKRLLQAIKKVEAGCFDISIANPNHDEIGNLSRSFEAMAKRLQDLLQEVQEKEKLKSRSELAALQSQINPHFMYNTLNSIKWMAILNKQENIKNMINSLINLLKHAARTDRTLITIREEIELLKDYIFVQSVRFANFQTVYEIPGEYLDYKILKFTLQPIIENCIIHGFGNSNKPGIINITVFENQGNLCIRVRDNGVGIKPEELDQLLTRKNNECYNNIGISNVHQRIVLNYGESYGLRLQSSVGEGTTVDITLPIIVDD